MVFSVKANKKRIIAVLVVIALVICGIIVVPKMVTAPMRPYGETPAQRTEFLKTFGWVVNAEPIDSREVTIPATFNEVYAKYNQMQKAQGFDLKPYAGQICNQYIYLVENYPGTDREIHATLLVYEGVVVGGDVCCAEVDGFMHGFALDSARYGEEDGKAKKTQPDTEASAALPEESAQAPADQGKKEPADKGEQAQTAEQTAALPEGDGGTEIPAENGDAADGEAQGGGEEAADAEISWEDYPVD